MRLSQQFYYSSGCDIADMLQVVLQTKSLISEQGLYFYWVSSICRDLFALLRAVQLPLGYKPLGDICTKKSFIYCEYTALEFNGNGVGYGVHLLNRPFHFSIMHLLCFIEVTEELEYALQVFCLTKAVVWYCPKCQDQEFMAELHFDAT
ncbi:hypothetical protein VNO77_42647 [Canavalia gladiata]|uniref:Uncharacterized protein n=1 Tax=Canavalia gladiata TaxID=3824 RepID=A0AAN9PM87_CANGL